MTNHSLLKKALSTSLSLLIFSASLVSLPAMATRENSELVSNSGSDVGMEEVSLESPTAAVVALEPARTAGLVGRMVGGLRWLTRGAIKAVQHSMQRAMAPFRAQEQLVTSDPELEMSVAAPPVPRPISLPRPPSPAVTTPPSSPTSLCGSDSDLSGDVTVIACKEADSPDSAPLCRTTTISPQDLEAAFDGAQTNKWRTACDFASNHKKELACFVIGGVCGEFAAEATENVVLKEIEGWEIGTFGCTPIQIHGVQGCEFNGTIGNNLAVVCFALVLIPITWEFTHMLNSVGGKALYANSWAKARTVSSIIIMLYAIVNAFQYLVPLAEYDQITYLIRTHDNPEHDPYFAEFMRTGVPYLVYHLYNSMISANRLADSVFIKLSGNKSNPKSKIRIDIETALKQRARSLDNLSQVELTELWRETSKTENYREQLRALSLSCEHLAMDEVIPQKTPRMRSALAAAACLVGPVAGAGLFLSGKFAGESAAESLNFDEEIQEKFGIICGAIVLSLSVAVKTKALIVCANKGYDIWSGYSENGLDLKSFKTMQRLVYIKNGLTGLALGTTKAAMAAVAFNGGLLSFEEGGRFITPRPMWQNATVLSALLLADGAVFANNLQKSYDEALGKTVRMACNPDAQGWLTKIQTKPEIMRDSLRLLIRSLIVLVQNISDSELDAIIADIYSSDTP